MRQLKIPQHTLTHNLLAIGYGGGLMIWLSTESTHVGLTAMLGFGLALMIVGLSVLHWLGGRNLNLMRGWTVLFGAITGAFTPITTFFLMLFKNVQHSHIVPDFSNEVMWEILARTPAWTLAGGLIGGAFLMLSLATAD
ncbi:MAG: hypothetical protein K8L91_12285 [Anaerolineae bacterium]|nr:hypothetical protein [Anaerolineae bacterium]